MVLVLVPRHMLRFSPIGSRWLHQTINCLSPHLRVHTALTSSPRTPSLQHMNINILQLSTRAGRKRARNPYDVLNVSRSATPKEIKIAYFKEAKKHHPDVNPNDPKAKERFQEVANAYEILIDEKKRRVYDQTGNAEQTQAQYQHQQQAEDIFNSVMDDFDVVTEAFESYKEDVKSDINYAVDCAKANDWKGVFEVASEYKGL